jgi:predicted RNase H-like nuclease (RuvC/YqgF family)
MKNSLFRLLYIVVLCLGAVYGDRVWAEESLVEAARREADRREEIERLGIEERIVQGNGGCYSGEGNVSVFSPPANQAKKQQVSVSSQKNRGNLRQYRSELRKRDKAIRKDETRLEKLQDRLQELRRKNLRLSDLSKIAGNEDSQDRTRGEIEELREALKLQKRERAEIYDAGKRDGFLPGELDGKGIIP